jgi:hypothetical protein
VASANRACFSKEHESENTTDENQQNWQTEMSSEHAESVKAAKKQKADSEYLESSRAWAFTPPAIKSGLNCAWNTIQVYSWSSLEYSAFFFCSDSYLHLTPEHKILYQRFFFNSEMSCYRDMTAEVMAQDPEKLQGTDQFLKLMFSSLKAWNLKRVRTQKLFPILCLRNIEDRLEKEAYE